MGTLANGIKDIFATSQTTATHLPVCASDGTPQGRIAVADLASVLGGLKTMDNIAGVDANTLRNDNILGYVQNSESWEANHYPASEGLFISFKAYSGGSRTLQLFQQRTNVKIYVRQYWGSGWTDWAELTIGLPTFYKNYNSLSALASGVLNNKEIAFEKKTLASTETYNVDNRNIGLLFLCERKSRGIGCLIGYNYSKTNISIIYADSGANTYVSLTKDTPLKINVYKENDGTTLTIQNNAGSERELYLWWLGFA